MAKKTNTSSTYWNALTQLISIIKTEYPNGGKLPPALEMSIRLNVSRMTYGKALKTVCTHGLAKASQGRAGTVIPPPMKSDQKVGLLLLDAGESPFISHGEELGAILQTLTELQLQQHIIQSASLEKLYEKLVIYNISGVISINPSVKMLEKLSDIRKKSGLPILATGFINYSQEKECRKAGIHMVQHDLQEESRKIVEFLVSKNFRNPMLIDGYFGFVDVKLNEHFSRYNIHMPEENCLLIRNIQSQLLKRIRKQAIDVLIIEGGIRVYLPLFDLLMQLPKRRRPAVLLRFSSDFPSNRLEKYPEIRILGLMKYDSRQLGVTAAGIMAEILGEGKPERSAFVDNFSIVS